VLGAAISIFVCLLPSRGTPEFSPLAFALLLWSDSGSHQSRNRGLAASLQRLTATSEIIRMSDAQPVFEAIANNAARFMRAWPVTAARGRPVGTQDRRSPDEDLYRICDFSRPKIRSQTGFNA